MNATQWVKVTDLRLGDRFLVSRFGTGTVVGVAIDFAGTVTVDYVEPNEDCPRSGSLRTNTADFVELVDRASDLLAVVR